MAKGAMIAVYVAGMLFFGSLNTITTKIQFTMSSVSITGEEKLFRMPWLATFNMFLGMSLALVVQRIVTTTCLKQNKVALPDEARGPLMDSGKTNGISYQKKICLVGIPSFFDLLATGLCSTGMLFIPASVWQMLRGAEIVFAAILAVTCLQRKLFAYNYVGLGLCVVGVTCVGLSNVWGSESQPAGGKGDGLDPTMLLVGMGMVVLGQVVQAAQVIAEEWLLVEVDLPEIEVIGYEGMWGLLQMIAIVYPIVYMIPGQDNGHLEDPFDSMVMLQNNSMLAVMICVYVFSCATYNVFGIAITGALSAVHRAILEASRTSVIWAFGLFIHYQVDPTCSFGEAWTPYSWLQLLGFVFLLFGQTIYGEILKLPGFYYPPSEDDDMAKMASPGSMKSFASPLPRTLVEGAQPLPSPSAVLLGNQA